MPRIYISLGSNINRDENTRSGIKVLQKNFGELELSSVYESESVGFEGDAFYNMVVGCKVTKDVHRVNKILNEIEDEYGRDRNGPRFSSRTLDLDLLLYDELILNELGLKLPRDEILHNAFVLWPLAEIAPDLVHPVASKSYAELWAGLDKSKESINPVEFKF